MLPEPPLPADAAPAPLLPALAVPAAPPWASEPPLLLEPALFDPPLLFEPALFDPPLLFEPPLDAPPLPATPPAAYVPPLPESPHATADPSTNTASSDRIEQSLGQVMTSSVLMSGPTVVDFFTCARNAGTPTSCAAVAHELQ